MDTTASYSFFCCNPNYGPYNILPSIAFRVLNLVQLAIKTHSCTCRLQLLYEFVSFICYSFLM